MCHKVHSLDVDAKKYELYENDMIDTDVAFSNLSRYDREFIQSGICRSCLDSLFNDSVF